MPLQTYLWNAALLLGGGCTMYAVGTQKPFAFTAGAMCCCRGIFGIFIYGKDAPVNDTAAAPPESSKSRDIFDLVMYLLDYTPLPLISVELLSAYQGSSIIALGHGFFYIPWCLVRLWIACDGEYDEQNESNLGFMIVMGNVHTLCYLMVNEDMPIFGVLAVSGWSPRFLSPLCSGYTEGEINCYALFQAIFIALAGAVCSGEGGSSPAPEV